jgi:hypothetical protein
MSTAVKVNSLPSKLTTDFLASAREAWGDALPDWVEELAKFATATSGVTAAKRIGMSRSVVTSVCRARYSGVLAAVEARVRGALMNENVDCPVLGEIGRDYCLDEQKKRHVGSSAVRTALFHACRSACQHSRLKSNGGHDA